VGAGLIDGTKLFLDASLIYADASNNSVVDAHSLKKYLNKGYRHLEARLDEEVAEKTTPANSRCISTTDPDASVTRHSGGKSKPRYKTHRAVDPAHEVITATHITPGSVNDGDMLNQMIETHKENIQKDIDTVVADSKYGTINNYLPCHDPGIKAHIPSLEKTHRGSKEVLSKSNAQRRTGKDVRLRSSFLLLISFFVFPFSEDMRVSLT